jgi:hypothetical protein
MSIVPRFSIPPQYPLAQTFTDYRPQYTRAPMVNPGAYISFRRKSLFVLSVNDVDDSAPEKAITTIKRAMERGNPGMKQKAHASDPRRFPPVTIALAPLYFARSLPCNVSLWLFKSANNCSRHRHRRRIRLLPVSIQSPVLLVRNNIQFSDIHSASRSRSARQAWRSFSRSFGAL